MRLAIGFLVFALAYALVPNEEGDDNGIIELKPETLHEAQDQSKSAMAVYLILFYAPWCPHCKRLMPIYEEAAKKLHTLYPALKVGQIDASKYRGELGDFQVKGYPTLVLLVNGVSQKYQGERSVDGLTKFVEENSQHINLS